MNLKVYKSGLFIPIFIFIISSYSIAQNREINPKLLHGTWTAHWIACPDIQAKAYGVYHFRKTVQLPSKPDHFIIHVSADNRYHLYVNGHSVGRGPARSSLYNWNFGTYDIAPYLHAGTNVLAAGVWNMGEYAPVAQISRQTGFLVQGDDIAEQIVNTDNSWKVLKDSAYRPTALDAGALLHSYVAVGACDEVQGKYYPWGWQQPDYDASAWEQAKVIHTPVVPSGYGTDNKWILSPRTIPPMEERMQRIKKLRRTGGIKVNKDFLQGNAPVTIPAHVEVTLLLDQSYETIGYPVLKVSGGADAKIKLTYAEALFDKNGRKGNRNEIAGKTIRGLYDIFYPDGGENRSFSTLWVRTWRYLQIKIKTRDEPLKLEDIYGIFSAYPLEQKATFSSSDPSLKKIWKTGWRTARLCAGETYFDCPYYEQLQYEGDTRIQALISLYNTGDDRLVRKAINDFYNSRFPNGLPQGRYPSNKMQIIPPYALFWVSMLYDYWMLCPDTAFLEKYLDAANLILKWYERHIDPKDGMLGAMEWWNFVDWDKAFRGGVPDGATDGHSSVITLQYAYTLQQASKLFAYYNRKEAARHYLKLARDLAGQTYQNCFDHQRMEMANQPRKEKFSQHAGIMALLADAIPADEEQSVMRNILEDTTLSQATFYFRFYLMRALIKTGNGDQYYSQLTPWRDMLKTGLTTFAEEPDPTRSDCHAWSASPNYDFLATICGIMPDAPGFKKVRIAPALGGLNEVSASMPLPGRLSEEKIKVHFKRVGKEGLKGTIILPENMDGVFAWKGKEIQLHEGSQSIDVN